MKKKKLSSATSFLLATKNKNKMSEEEVRILPLTKANLKLMGVEPPRSPGVTTVVVAGITEKVVPAAKLKRPLSAAQIAAHLQNTQRQYAEYLNEFKTGVHTEIYDLLKPIAKRKYSKIPEVAEYQEQFYQSFINDKHLDLEVQWKDMYENMDNLRKMRAKVDAKK